MKRLVAVLIVVAAICLLTVPGLLLLPAPTSGATSTWQKTSLDAGRVHAILVHPTNPGTVFAGTDQGLFRSTDRGGTWEQYGTGIKATLKVFVLAAAGDGSRLYAGTSGGAFQSTDGGATWSQGSGMLPGTGIIRYYYAITTLAVDPANPQTVYAGDTGMMTEGRVLKSTDGGATWTMAASGISSDHVTALAIDPGRPATVYAVVEDSLYVSGDAGASWTKTTGKMLVNSSEADVMTVMVTSDAVYAGTTAGVWKSRDGGVTWSQGTGLSTLGALKYFFGIAALAVDPGKSSVLYAGDSGLMTSGGVYSSTDSGASWTQAGGTLTGDISALAVDSSNPRMVYAATAVGLYRLENVPVVQPPVPSYTLVLTIGSSAMSVDGTRATLDSPPIIREGRTLLPIRAVIEALEGSVGWDAVARKATVTLGTHTIEIWIGSNQARVNGADVPLDVAAMIVNSRTLLPLRFVAENLGCTVTWDPVGRTVTIKL